MTTTKRTMTTTTESTVTATAAMPKKPDSRLQEALK